MAIILNHTIVPARDKEASARFFADIFGLKYEGSSGHFAPVRVNETLTLDFDTHSSFETLHYAFHVSDEEFDAILKRVKQAGTVSSIPGMAEEACTSAIRTDIFSNS
jgi:catechol 2,3-dioxygenase-like lactoylglutathione lyase family enzyme